MVHNNFFVYAEMFLNDEPYCFLVFMKALGSYHFDGQMQFINALRIINFETNLRKFSDNDIIHTEIMTILKLYMS